MSGFSDAHEIFQRNGRRVLVQREGEILDNSRRGRRMSPTAWTDKAPFWPSTSSDSNLSTSTWSIENLSRIQQPVRIQRLLNALHNCHGFWPYFLEELVLLEETNRMLALADIS